MLTGDILVHKFSDKGVNKAYFENRGNGVVALDYVVSTLNGNLNGVLNGVDFSSIKNVKTAKFAYNGYVDSISSHTY